MKKISLAFSVILIFILINVSACMPFKKATLEVIRPKTLSSSQEDLLTLMESPQSEVLFFSYSSRKALEKLSIWVDIYQEGELIESQMKGMTISAHENKQIKGDIVVKIDTTPDYIWSFVDQRKSGKMSIVSSPSTYYGESYMQVWMTQPQKIEAGKEIVLYARVFANDRGEIKAPPATQDFITSPEQIKNYSFVHVVKCKFYN